MPPSVPLCLCAACFFRSAIPVRRHTFICPRARAVGIIHVAPTRRPAWRARPLLIDAPRPGMFRARRLEKVRGLRTMAPPTATAPQPPPPRTAPRSRHTILVVDDEPDVVKSVKDLLRLEYRVLGATSPEEGLELMRREQVHIVMTDQRMPGMSGVELLKQVRGYHPDATRLL